MMKYSVFVAILALLAAGCGSFPSTDGLEREEIIELANEYFQNGKYRQSSFLYTELMFRYPGDINTDFFLLRSGLSNREMKCWADAEFYLYRVVNEFPTGPWSDDAQFALAETMWMQRRDYRRDQTQVVRAREELLRFFDEYPSSDMREAGENLLIQVNNHLAMRSLSVGKFYTRRHETDAALLYLRDALDNYGETSCRGSVLIAMGDLYRSTGNTYSARTYYNRALDDCELTTEEEEKALEGLRELE